MQNKKSILVTGGTGFIGSNLVKELVDLGEKVIVVDIEIKPNSTFVVDYLYKKTILELVDIRQGEKIFEVFDEYKPEIIFHLAAEATVTSGVENPRLALETNIMGTVNVLEAARKSDSVKGIIVASSDKAYGKLSEAKSRFNRDRYRETDPLRGDHPYDVSKSAADLISLAYYKTYSLPVVVTRFGNVYGEGDLHFERIIPGICEAIIKKKPLEIRSNGKYVRDYLYVGDVVGGYLFLMKNFAKVRGEAFNFSSTETLSVLDLIKKAEKILDISIPYKILNNAKNEIPYQHLDDSKIKKLGWKNEETLASSLKKILDWYTKIC